MIRRTIILILLSATLLSLVLLAAAEPRPPTGSTWQRWSCSLSERSRFEPELLFSVEWGRFWVVYCEAIRSGEQSAVQRMLGVPDNGCRHQALGLGVFAFNIDWDWVRNPWNGQQTGWLMAGLHVPLWMAAILCSIYPAIALIRGPLRRHRRRKKGLCLKCGYNLTGNVTGVCPECGEAV